MLSFASCATEQPQRKPIADRGCFAVVLDEQDVVDLHGTLWHVYQTDVVVPYRCVEDILDDILNQTRSLTSLKEKVDHVVPRAF